MNHTACCFTLFLDTQKSTIHNNQQSLTRLLFIIFTGQFDNKWKAQLQAVMLPVRQTRSHRANDISGLGLTPLVSYRASKIHYLLVLSEWVLSKFNGTLTPKGSYRAKTGHNDCNVNSNRNSLSTALCESICYRAKSEQNVRQDLTPRGATRRLLSCTPLLVLSQILSQSHCSDWWLKSELLYVRETPSVYRSLVAWILYKWSLSENILLGYISAADYDGLFSDRTVMQYWIITYAGIVFSSK